VLQGELHVIVTTAESCAAVVAECDASIAFIMTQMEKALKDETTTSVTLAQARMALTDTIRVF
jgi:hypothetical protein